MKTMLVAASLFCISLSAFSQGLNSVHSPNGVDVWAVGKQGTVFHSFDGGVTWAMHQLGAGTIHGVHSRDQYVWIVGENGLAYRSTNAGNDWLPMTIGSGTSLRAVDFVTTSTGWVVGVNGVILRTLDGGASWSPQNSGTSEQLNALAFQDSLTGFAVGNNGLVLKTTNGGSQWNTISAGDWRKHLTSVGVKNQTVYVTGMDAFCAKSTDGGTTWASLNFKTDSQSDVTGVFLKSAENAYFIGGGGFIRESIDGGSTFRWATHPLHASVNDIFFHDNVKGWVCSGKYNVVMRTTDGGTTWQLPQGTTTQISWIQKLTASGAIGNSLMINPWDKNKIYVVLGRFIYMSANRGEAWVQTSAISPTNGSTHSFYISSKDTNHYIAAFSGGGDHIRRSTDRGLTWTTTISRAFSAFGMPLEIDGSHPDTLYFAPEDGHIYRTTDFGATWTDLGAKGFTSPCDVVVVRDSSNIIWVGDSGPSRISRSTDAGQTWSLIHNGSSSEIPTMANSSLQNSVGYATSWGSGGVQKTVSFGAAWLQTATTGSAWGVDIARDDPNVVMFGVYGGGLSYLSVNAGSSFTTASLSGSNYGILAYDRSTFIAEQSGGVHKLSIAYTVPTSNQQAVGLIAPNGGENWQYNTSRTIAWTAANFSSVKIEYKTSPASPWQTIVASVPATNGSYAWTIPNAPTVQARVRISDAIDGIPSDSSEGIFSITVAGFLSAPSSLHFPGVGVGHTKKDTLRLTNNGSAPLVISSAVTGSQYFIAGRTSFTIPPGGSDTLGVQFSPSAVQSYSDTLRLGTNSPAGVVAIPLSGNGILAAAVTVVAPNGGEIWNVGSTHDVRWTSTLVDQVAIHYRILPAVKWWLVAANVPSAGGQYAWTIPNAPANEVLVRVSSAADGTVYDESNGSFRIQPATSVPEGAGIPAKFELAQNYPNPFNPATQIRYGLPKDSHVRLAVFNALGQEVAELVNVVQRAGWYTAEFSGIDLSSGVYYYRMVAGDLGQTRKFVLLK